MHHATAGLGPLAALPALQRPLTLALAASLFLHAVLLSVHFGLPQALNLATDRALDVILVNSKSAGRPDKAQALAQNRLDGGGNTDEARIASTPLPASLKTREGNELVEAQRRVAELERKQRQALAQARATFAVKPSPQNSEALFEGASGFDLANSALAIARLEGQIARNVEEYNKRPRKKFIGARTDEYRFAQYVEDWRQKVERVGNLNYPESARGRLYGKMKITVIIKSDGGVERVEITEPSAHRLLDDAARRIVQLAAPYAAFPPDIARDTDIIEITRTWAFTSADRLNTE